MARPATASDARLRRFRDAAKRIAEAAQPGTVLSFEPMMQLLGVNRPTLRDWCRDIEGFATSGCFNGGAEGVKYEFNPAATVWFLIGHFERLRQSEIDAARKTRELVGGAETLQGLPDEYSLKDIREAIQTAALVREEKVRSGELVEVGPLRMKLRAMFTRMQEVMMTAASRADPTGQWLPHIRESFEDEIGNVGIEMVRAGEAVLGDLNGGTSQPGATAT